MSKKRKKIDPNQLSLDFNAKINSYIDAKEEILRAMESGPPVSSQIENEFEACIEIAAAIKRALRESGMSREQLVDAINKYFGRTPDGAKEEPPTCRNPLSINMLNNYLSKPCEAPIPTYYILAIQNVTGSLEPTRLLAEAEDARVASGAEIRQMALGKLEDNINEMRRLKKELNGRR